MSTTSETKPSSYARSALIRSCRPVSAMRIATLSGSTRASRTDSRSGDQPDAHVRVEELRPIGRDHDVAGRHEVEARTAAQPVHRGEDRLGHRAERRRRLLRRVPLRVRREVGLVVDDAAVVGDLGHVGARAERAARARDRRSSTPSSSASAAVVRVPQLADHLRAHRVQLVGPVERDRRDPVVDVVQDRLVVRGVNRQRGAPRSTSPGRARASSAVPNECSRTHARFRR